MNCLNCGAPTTPVAGRNYFLCPYCESHRDLSDAAATTDGVVASSEQTDSDCPSCPSEPLLLAALDGVEVQHCPACQGLMLGNEQFREVLRRRRMQYDGPDDRPAPLDPAELQRRLECPRCRRPMEVHPYYGPGNAVIDSCFACRVVWLDRGEFAALERAPGVRG